MMYNDYKLQQVIRDIELCSNAITYSEELLDSHQIHDTNEFISLESYELLPLNHALAKLGGETISLEGIKDWAGYVGDKIIQAYHWLVEKLKQFVKWVSNFIAGETKSGSIDSTRLKIANKKTVKKAAKAVKRSHIDKGVISRGIKGVSTNAISRLAGKPVVGSIDDKDLTIDTIDEILKFKPLTYTDKEGNSIVVVGDLPEAAKQNYQTYLSYATSVPNIIKYMKELNTMTDRFANEVSIPFTKITDITEAKLNDVLDRKRLIKSSKELITLYNDFTDIITAYDKELEHYLRKLIGIYITPDLPITGNIHKQMNTVFRVWNLSITNTGKFNNEYSKVVGQVAKKKYAKINNTLGVINRANQITDLIRKFPEPDNKKAPRFTFLINNTLPHNPLSGNEGFAKRAKAANKRNNTMRAIANNSAIEGGGLSEAKYKELTYSSSIILHKLVKNNKALLLMYKRFSAILDTENRINFLTTIHDTAPTFYVDKKVAKNPKLLNKLVEGLYIKLTTKGK